MHNAALLVGAVLQMVEGAVSSPGCPEGSAGFLCTQLTHLQQPYGQDETQEGTGRAWALHSAPAQEPALVWVFLNGRNPQYVKDHTLTEPRFAYDRLLLQWRAVPALPPVWLWLPQATSVAGHETPNPLFPLFTWLEDMQHRLAPEQNTSAVAVTKPLIVMAHSGGGSVLTQALVATLPPHLRAAVWFDGINGPQESQQLAQVLAAQLQRQGDQLAACQQEGCLQDQLRTAPWFLWYHSNASAYEQRHRLVTRLLQQQFLSLHTTHARVPQWAWRALRAHYLVTPVENVPHSDLMRAGWVQHALQTVFTPNNLQAARDNTKSM